MTSKMRPEDVSSLRDLGRYVADNADQIFIPVDRGDPKPLSKLPTRQALRWQAEIVASGKIPPVGGTYAPGA